MDQDATWYGGRHRPKRPHCAKWGPSSPAERDTAVPTFRLMSMVAKRSPISATAELLLWPPYGIGRPYFCPVSSSSFFFSSPNLSRLPYFHTWCGLSANLECMFEMCCTWLAGNAGPKKSPKIRHLGTIAQLCRAILRN